MEFKAQGHSERALYYPTEKTRYFLWAEARGVDTLSLPFEFSNPNERSPEERFYAVDWGSVIHDGHRVAMVFTIYKNALGRRVRLTQFLMSHTPLPYQALKPRVE